jgi:hypothetical protein
LLPTVLTSIAVAMLGWTKLSSTVWPLDRHPDLFYLDPQRSVPAAHHLADGIVEMSNPLQTDSHPFVGIGLRKGVDEILAANGADVDRGRDAGMDEALLDRLCRCDAVDATPWRQIGQLWPVRWLASSWPYGIRQLSKIIHRDAMVLSRRRKAEPSSRNQKSSGSRVTSW